MNIDPKTIGALAFIVTLAVMFSVLWKPWLAFTLIVLSLILWAIYEFMKKDSKKSEEDKNLDKAKLIKTKKIENKK